MLSERQETNSKDSKWRVSAPISVSARLRGALRAGAGCGPAPRSLGVWEGAGSGAQGGHWMSLSPGPGGGAQQRSQAGLGLGGGGNRLAGARWAWRRAGLLLARVNQEPATSQEPPSRWQPVLRVCGVGGLWHLDSRSVQPRAASPRLQLPYGC